MKSAPWFDDVQYFTDMGTHSRLAKEGIDWNEYLVKTAVCLGLFGLLYSIKFIRKQPTEK